MREQAENAAYTAVGFAVLGFQRVQYARRQLRRDLEARALDLTPEAAADIEAIADVVDAGLVELTETALPPFSESAAITLSAARHMRETWLDPLLAQAGGDGNTTTSTTPDPATEDT